MNEAQRYAISLGEQYNIDVSGKLELLTNYPEEYNTAYDVAAVIFSPDQMVEWLKSDKEETKRLRIKHNIQPFDKLDADYNQMISEWQQKV